MPAPRPILPPHRAQLDVVDDRADRDVAKRKGVAGSNLSALARLQQVAHLDAGGSEDVALLAVEIVEQRDAGVAVRVVLDRRDLGRHAVLVAVEVDDPVRPLVASAAVAGGLAAVAVAAAGLRAGTTSERSGRSRVISAKSETVWNRRPGLVGFRDRSAMAVSWCSALEEVDRVAGGEGDHGPLLVGPLTPHVRTTVPGGLALAVKVLTLVTRTLKACSTA